MNKVFLAYTYQGSVFWNFACFSDSYHCSSLVNIIFYFKSAVFLCAIIKYVNIFCICLLIVVSWQSIQPAAALNVHVLVHAHVLLNLKKDAGARHVLICASSGIRQSCLMLVVLILPRVLVNSNVKVLLFHSDLYIYRV